MKVHTAQLAGGTTNADRVFVTDQAVIVLDGASAHEPVDVDPATYAQLLGETIANQLDHSPAADLADVVGIGIRRAAVRLHLTAGAGTSPSSTVSILRARDGRADLYVLGDSPIHYGNGVQDDHLVDERMSAIAIAERDRYVSQLVAGHGYDSHHREALSALQSEQRRHRNVPDGYWIAEADPAAADHAVTMMLDSTSVAWAVLATDGAADIIDHTGPSWAEIAQYDAGRLTDLLRRLHEWEGTSDPNGRTLPRAKRHDDKTVAAIPVVF
ncbi:MAG: hypothetical protein J0I49_02715 [Pseudonocardia sp.]|uniref:hypothetical protein n=1 Tax=Pseudonocardia sp. TaxID=60912 RepID=UPI001AC86BC7|nr:hypothetical protein [Pseudonocardia sp.]MBN9097016.1 hypothetical protein [Pseudonocardia sp.]